MFDNSGTAGYPLQARLYSRVIEIDPFSFEKLWDYNGYHSGQTAFSFFSPLMSSAQRLPNGNNPDLRGRHGTSLRDHTRGGDHLGVHQPLLSPGTNR